MERTRNPYDRRNRPISGMMSSGQFPMRLPSSISLEDLDALVASAVDRGRQSAREEVYEQIPTTQRQEWENGWHVGCDDMRAEFARRVFDLREPYSAASAVAFDAAEQPRTVTKEQAVKALKELRQVVANLLTSIDTKSEEG